VSACTFTNKVERLKLEILSGKVKDSTLQSIQEDISLLPNFVYEDISKQDSLQICRSGLEKATPAELNQMIDDLADMMKNRRERPNSFLELDLADTIASRGYITLGEGGEQIYVEEYRRRVEEKILEIIDSDPVMMAISSGQAVNDLELVSLERRLKIELGADNIQLSQSNIRKAFKLKVNNLLSFVRQLLELEMMPDYDEIVTRNFEEYISQGLFNANQIRFLRAVQGVFLQKRKLELADLYEAPLDNFGDDAVEKWFNEEQVNDLINFTDRFAA
jgi:type I restriction enzyme R subunit